MPTFHASLKRLVHLFFPPYYIEPKQSLSEKQLALVRDLHKMTSDIIAAENSKPYWLAWAKKTSAKGGVDCEPDASWADQICVLNDEVRIHNVNGIRGKHVIHPIAKAYPNYADFLALCRRASGGK